MSRQTIADVALRYQGRPSFRLGISEGGTGRYGGAIETGACHEERRCDLDPLRRRSACCLPSRRASRAPQARRGRHRGAAASPLRFSLLLLFGCRIRRKASRYGGAFLFRERWPSDARPPHPELAALTSKLAKGWKGVTSCERVSRESPGLAPCVECQPRVWRGMVVV